MLAELAQDPDECDLAIIFNNLIGLDAANKWYKIIDEVRILPQDVLQHGDGLRCHIRDLQTKEILQLGADHLAEVWQADHDSSEARDGALCNIGADIRHVLAQLVHNLLNVALACYLRQDLQFKVLDVRWLIILNEELLEIGLKDKVGASEDK